MHIKRKKCYPIDIEMRTTPRKQTKLYAKIYFSGLICIAGGCG